MMSKSLTIYMNARTQSTRCSNKMLRPFAGSTLIDIALAKLKHLQRHCDVVFAAHEDVLLEKSQSLSLPTHKRSYASSISEDNRLDIFEVLKDVSSEYVGFLNPCCPCMSLQTITKAIDHFLSSDWRRHVPAGSPRLGTPRR